MEELTFHDHIMQQAPYLRVWVGWLVIFNISAIFFVWRHIEARWVLAAMLLNFPLMNLFFAHFGWVRLLGMSHAIVWTPLLVYLWLRRDKIEPKTPFGIYITVLFLTDFISLFIDYIDVIRYLTGDQFLP